MDGNSQFITVWDPARHYEMGTLVTGDRVTVGRRRGVVMLPIDIRSVYATPSGFFHRTWGAGWAYDNMMAERGCPMILAADPSYQWVYWVAAIAPIRTGEMMVGQLRLVNNGANGCISAGMSQDQIPPLLQNVPAAPMLIGGRCQLSVAMPGVLGLSVYGSARNVMLRWSAVSISSEQFDIGFNVPMGDV